MARMPYADNKPHSPKQTAHPAIGAGANGVGGGAFTVWLADIFPPTTAWHHLLAFATPFVTLGCSALYFIFYRRVERWQFEATLRTAMATVEREISNPNTTP